MSVRLAGAGRADEEHEVALGDDQVDVAQGELAVRVRLRHVVEDEDGPFLLGLVAGPAEDPASDGARGALGWGDGHIGSAGVADGDGRRSSARSHDSVRGHDRGESLQGRGYHSGGTPANGTDGASPHRTFVQRAARRLQQTRRDRQVAREVRERPIPAHAGPGTGRAGSPPGEPARPPDPPRRRPTSRTRRAAATADVRWPRTGPSSASSRTATGPSRPASPA